MIQNLESFTLVAYRGGAGERPENTIEAFAHSHKRSESIVLDLDLELSKDNILMVFHDDDLSSLTNGSGKVADFTVQELKELDAAYHFKDDQGEYSYRDKNIKIPTLDEVMIRFPQSNLLLDIRYYSELFVNQVIESVEKHHASERVIIMSELDSAIEKCRGLRPNWNYAAATEETRGVIFANKEPVSDYFMIPEVYNDIPLLSENLLTKLHQKNRKVWIWTVDDLDDFLRLRKMGVDGIFTNYPSLMLPHSK